MATEQIGLLASDLTVMQQCYLSTMLTAPVFSLYKYKYKYKIKTYNAPYVTRVIRRRVGIDIVESQQ